MPSDQLFQSIQPIENTIELEADASLQLSMLGCMVLLAGFTLDTTPPDTLADKTGIVWLVGPGELTGAIEKSLDAGESVAMTVTGEVVSLIQASLPPDVLDSKQDSRAELTKYGVKGATVASAATVDLDAATGDYVAVSGNVSITGITLAAGSVRTVRFTGNALLTNGANLILPGNANISTAPGDIAIFRGDGSGAVRCVGFQPAVGYSRVGHTHSADEITDLGTAATLDAGTGAGEVLVLDDDAKVPLSAIPEIAVTRFLGVVADEASMLLLDGQFGDWCIRTDVAKTFIITGEDPTVIGDWTAVAYPAAQVMSVAGKTGTVLLVKADVGLNLVDNTSDLNKPISTAAATLFAKRAIYDFITSAPATVRTLDAGGYWFVKLNPTYPILHLNLPEADEIAWVVTTIDRNFGNGNILVNGVGLIPGQSVMWFRRADDNSWGGIQIPMNADACAFAIVTSNAEGVIQISDVYGLEERLSSTETAVGGLVHDVDELQGLVGDLRDVTWGDIIRANPLVVPIRGFANSVSNYGSGQAVASVKSDGFNVYFQGVITRTTASDLDVLYDVPNGFAPPAPVRGAVVRYDGTSKLTPAGIEIGDASGNPPQSKLLRALASTVNGPVLENNVVSVPQSNCAGGIRKVLGSDTVSILLPNPLPLRSALKVVLYNHGASNDCYSHLSDAAAATSTARLMRATVNALLNDGWIIVASNGGANADNWGNPAAWTATQAALAWIDANLGDRSKTVVLGQSMGALTSLITATSLAEVTKWYGIYPVCNLNGWAGTSAFQSNVFTAWGVASTGALATASVGYDPVLLGTSVFNGKDFRMTASTADAVVPKANNTDVLVSHITGHCNSVNVVAHTGNHGDPSAFQASDIVSFFNS